MTLAVASFANVSGAYASDLLAHGTLTHKGEILKIDDAIYLALKAKHNKSAPQRLGNALVSWVSKGMPITSPDTLKSRQETCKSCEHFTGLKCKLCGCFTEAKLRMASEKCPIGKW